MNPYTVLGVEKGASKPEIRKAYYDLAKVMHPDKGGNEDEFKPIAEAWAVLSNDEKRVEYDKTGLMPVDIEQAILGEAIAFIARMVNDTLKSMVKNNMERQPGDFVEAMRKYIRNKMIENDQDIRKTHVAEKLFADTLDRLFLKSPDEFDGADVITGQVKQMMEENDFNQFALGNGRKVLTKALVMLDEFGFNIPEMIAQSSPTFTIKLGGWDFSNLTTGSP